MFRTTGHLGTLERDQLARRIRSNKSLAEAASYAVRDAVTFAGCIAVDKREEVLARANAISEEQRPDVLQVAIPKVKREDDVSSPAIDEMRSDKEERERVRREKIEKEREARESARAFSSIRRSAPAASSSISSSFDLSAFLPANRKKPKEVKPTQSAEVASEHVDHKETERHLKEEWSIEDIKKIADDVEKKRAAECQSFAALLVAKLQETLESDVRVQIVAHRDHKGLVGTHNYVLINFKGDRLSYEEIEAQKNTVLIGDLWLLALGHDQVKNDGSSRLISSNGIYTFNQYPIDHVMLKDLVEIYDSAKQLLKKEHPNPTNNNS